MYDLWKQRAAEWAQSDKQHERRAAADHYAPLAAKHPPLYSDFRRMLDEAGDQIDAVVVATPDHTHAVIAAAALRAGKPVFCEKPLTISAHEARALHRLAKETKLPTQMNNHGASRPAFRRGVEIIRDGVLGDVQQVHVFFSRGGRDFQKPPQGSPPVPKALNWNLWLAQVAWRDYHPDWINRVAWRDTSIGELGNFGPHAANMAFMALNVKDLWKGGPQRKPIRVESEASSVNHLSYPRWERIRWHVPMRGSMPPVTFTWHHGPDYAPGTRELIHEKLRAFGVEQPDAADAFMKNAGSMLVGSEGALLANDHSTRVTALPAEKFARIETDRPRRIVASRGIYRDWIDACRGHQPRILANFDNGGPLSELLMLGNIATRYPGETLSYDPAAGRVETKKVSGTFFWDSLHLLRGLCFPSA